MFPRRQRALFAARGQARSLKKLSPVPEGVTLTFPGACALTFHGSRTSKLQSLFELDATEPGKELVASGQGATSEK
jgi:hypothetical protein